MQMFRKSFEFCPFLLLIIVFMTGAQAQTKEIAFTIDDLPLNGPPIGVERLRKMTAKLLAVVEKNRIPMVGFVNEGLLYAPNETDARIAVLKMWTDAGLELGNHTFSHLGFQNASLADFEDDFIRGESVTKMLMKPNKIRYFRHPFLQMGATRELEDAFRKFIGERGYTAVPVTMDTLDWMFLASYAKALNENDRDFKEKVTAEYLKFVGLKIDSSEKIAGELFGRSVKHILLLHVNELNADNFEALVEIFKRKGYRFVSVEEALRDEIYRFPDNYAPTSDWLSHWASSKGKKFETPRPPEFVQKIYQGK